MTPIIGPWVLGFLVFVFFAIVIGLIMNVREKGIVALQGPAIFLFVLVAPWIVGESLVFLWGVFA